MELFAHLFESGFAAAVTVIIHVLEIMGIAVICTGAVRDFIEYFTHKANIKLDLAESLALGLEFMLGGEILRPCSRTTSRTSPSSAASSFCASR